MPPPTRPHSAVSLASTESTSGRDSGIFTNTSYPRGTFISSHHDTPTRLSNADRVRRDCSFSLADWWPLGSSSSLSLLLNEGFLEDKFGLSQTDASFLKKSNTPDLRDDKQETSSDGCGELGRDDAMDKRGKLTDVTNLVADTGGGDSNDGERRRSEYIYRSPVWRVRPFTMAPPRSLSLSSSSSSSSLRSAEHGNGSFRQAILNQQAFYDWLKGCERGTKKIGKGTHVSFADKLDAMTYRGVDDGPLVVNMASQFTYEGEGKEAQRADSNSSRSQQQQQQNQQPHQSSSCTTSSDMVSSSSPPLRRADRPGPPLAPTTAAPATTSQTADVGTPSSLRATLSNHRRSSGSSILMSPCLVAPPAAVPTDTEPSEPLFAKDNDALRPLPAPFMEPLSYVQKSSSAMELTHYRDIRVAADERGGDNGNGYAMMRGSRVLYVGDIQYTDLYFNQRMAPRLGDAFVVLYMFGDLWAICAPLVLSGLSMPQSATGSVAASNGCQEERALRPNLADSLVMIPLCALTLDTNFGQYILRHPRVMRQQASTPAEGQVVVPPDRVQSVVGEAEVDRGRLVSQTMMDLFRHEPMPADAPFVERRPEQEAATMLPGPTPLPSPRKSETRMPPESGAGAAPGIGRSSQGSLRRLFPARLRSMFRRRPSQGQVQVQDAPEQAASQAQARQPEEPDQRRDDLALFDQIPTVEEGEAQGRRL